MPKVSILVPIFNVESYLRECLDSVVNQTLRSLEIICINDGSTDGSLAIIEEYAKRDDRFVIIDKPNSGYGDSMNQGLQRATGDYIGIVESDDWAEPNMFEELFRLAEKHKAQVAKSEFYSYYTTPEKRGMSGVKSNLIPENEVHRPINPRFDYLIFFQQPSIWSAIYRRDFLIDNEVNFLPSPGASYQDTGFNFKVWAASSRVVFTKDAYLHYRRDSEGSSVNDPGKVFCVSDEYAEIERYLRSRDIDPKLLQYMRATKWGGYRWNIERLTSDLAKQFIEHASEEYLRDYNSGEFRFQFCDVNFHRGIFEIMHHPEMAVARKEAQSKAKVSVVFPVYNVEEYVRPSLESLLKQTLEDIEVIVIDDGSTDGSIEIVEEYLARDPRVRLIHQGNQGLSVARNEGVALAQAQYLAFLDSDDLFDDDALERLYEAMTTHPVQLVCGTSRVVFDRTQRTSEERYTDARYVGGYFSGEHEINGEVLDWVDVHVWNKLFVTDLVKHNNLLFPAGLKYEDAFFLNVYAWNSDRVYFLNPDEPIHTYVRRPGAIMTNTFSGTTSSRDHLKIVYLLFDEVQKHGRLERFGPYYLLLLDRYLHFALTHAAQSERVELWRTFRLFFAKHSKLLRSMNPEHFDAFKPRVFPAWLRHFDAAPRLQYFVLRAGGRAKSLLRR